MKNELPSFVCAECHYRKGEWCKAVVCTDCVDELKEHNKTRSDHLSDLTNQVLNSNQQIKDLQTQLNAACRVLVEDHEYDYGDLFRAMQNKMEE